MSDPAPAADGGPRNAFVPPNGGQQAALAAMDSAAGFSCTAITRRPQAPARGDLLVFDVTGSPAFHAQAFVEFVPRGGDRFGRRACRVCRLLTPGRLGSS